MSAALTLLPIDHRAVFAEHVAGRRVVYLDTSAWGDLTAPDASALRRRLRERVRAGALALPLSYASLAELWHHPDVTHRERIAKCMDDLTGGICFRFVTIIGEIEAEQTWPWLVGGTPAEAGRERLFTYAAFCLGSGALEFPPGWSREGADRFSRLVAEAPEVRSVTWLVTHLSLDAMRANWLTEAQKIEELQRGREAALRSSSHFRTPSGRIDYARVLQEERTYLLREMLLPALIGAMLQADSPATLPGQIQQHLDRVGEGGPERLGELFALVPSFEMRAQVFAARVRNPERRDRAQDFWDHQHGAVAPVYADGFVASDRGLVDLVGRRCSLPKERGCEVVLGLKGLDELLQQWGMA